MKNKIIQWCIIIIYILVLLGLCILIPILSGNNNDTIMVISIMIFCLLGTPVIILNTKIFEFFSKDKRMQRAIEREKIKEKNRIIREEFELPNYIETVFEHKLISKKRVIISAVILSFGIISFFVLVILFSFIDINDILEIVLVLFSLSITAYAFFIAFNKPFLGILHTLAPFILFFTLPLILQLNGVTNEIVLVATCLGSGLILYSSFMFLTVTIPIKKYKKIKNQYLIEFQEKNNDYKAYQALSHDICLENYGFYVKEKFISISLIDDVCFIVIYADTIYQGKVIKDVPVYFEKYNGNKIDALYKSI